MALVCTNCGYVGSARKVTPGSIWIELGLYLSGLLTLIFVIGFLLLLGGLIYSIWRITKRHWACPSCGAPNLVSDQSPVGKRVIAQNENSPSSSSSPPPA